MARTTNVTLIDDLDGTEASETVTIGLDGASFELDLSEANATALRQALAPWVDRARPSGAAPRVLPSHRVTVLPPVGGSRSALIRAWAAGNGYAVPARGSIPSAVTAAYDNAHR